MVLISKIDQEKVNRYIENVEKELRLLRLHLNHVARKSNEKGFLQVGDFIKIGAKPDTPNEEPTIVLGCGKIINVKYCIKTVKVKHVERRASEGKTVVKIYEFNSDNSKNLIFDTIEPPMGVDLYDVEVDDKDDDENEESSEEEYHNEIDDNNTD